MWNWPSIHRPASLIVVSSCCCCGRDDDDDVIAIRGDPRGSIEPFNKAAIAVAGTLAADGSEELSVEQDSGVGSFVVVDIMVMGRIIGLWPADIKPDMP